MSTLNELVASRRARLVALLIVASIGITVLAASAAGSSLSYYVTLEEFNADPDPIGTRWRIGARVVEGSVVEASGQPMRFEVQGESGDRLAVTYDGVVPNLFGPNAWVIIEGTADSPGHLEASSVIIKHENEFYADEPPPDSPSSSFYSSPAAGD